VTKKANCPDAATGSRQRPRRRRAGAWQAALRENLGRWPGEFVNAGSLAGRRRKDRGTRLAATNP